VRGTGRRGDRSSLKGVASGHGKQARLPELYWALAEVIQEINTTLFCKLTGDRAVAHYTTLHVLRDLVESGNPFRLYNSAYMNDPDEGRVFFKIMKDRKIDVEKIFYENDSEDSHSSPAYIGSFVRTDSRNEEGKDKLFLWRTYGKHDGEEAGGACLIFNKDQFARKVPPMETVTAHPSAAVELALKLKVPPMKIGTMPRLEYGAKQGKSTGQNDPPLPYRPSLYRVIYKSEIRGKLSENLGKLAGLLNEINKLLQPPKKRDEDKEMFTKVRKQLDRIRFLFKADHYRGEQEVRVVQMSYTDDPPSPEREVAMDQIPPRFYLEMPVNFRFNEVILGPKTGNVSEWQQWMSEKSDIKVEKSRIPFR